MAVLLAGTALAQGTVKFSNYSTVDGINAPFFTPEGVKLGSAYLGQLYAGPTGDSLAPVGSAIPFRNNPATGAGTGYVVGGTVTINSVAPGANAFVQLRAWEATGGTSYEAAQAAGVVYGASATIWIATGGGGSPPATPAPLTGLQSFSLIPEPAPAWLLAVGLAGLALARRRN